MKIKQSKILMASVIALTLFSAQAVMADEFVLTFNIPVDVSKLSPTINVVLADCFLFDRNGVKIMKQIPSEDCCGASDIDKSHSFKGTLAVHQHFDLAVAKEIDWGTYTCKVRFSDDKTVGWMTENHANPVFRAKPGSVITVSGKLY